MTTDAARRAVFNTPELLENIISFVSPTDIRTKVQRVSRQWKEAVDSSPVIKNKLWMRGSHVSAVQPSYFSKEHTFPQLVSWGKLGMPVYSHDVAFNPISLNGQVGSLRIELDETMPHRLLEKSNGDIVHPKAVDFSQHKARGSSDSSAVRLRYSWRDMYLTYPPIATAVVHACNFGDPGEEFGPEVIEMLVRDHGGLTLGLIYDILMAGLPSNVHKKLETTRCCYMGSLYTGFE